MEPSKTELLFNMMYKLLMVQSTETPDPESLKLFYGGYLGDMLHPSGGRPSLEQEEQVYFQGVLCLGDEVLAVALPCFSLSNGGPEELETEALEALRAAGLPLFSELLSPDGELDLELCRKLSPSGWKLPFVPVPRELDELLAAKKMVAYPPEHLPVPTQYGRNVGLCQARWYGRDPDSGSISARGCEGLFCSAAGWVHLWERPWNNVPKWEVLSLDVRLSRLKAGRSCNPGHCMSAFLRLEAMPLAPVLAESLNGEYIRKNLTGLRALYGPGVTYGQAARNAARLMGSSSEKERELGRSSLYNLMSFVRFHYQLRRKGISWMQAVNAEDNGLAIVNARPGDHSLSTRLARAGISGDGSPDLPLLGEDLEDVFQGLSCLTGSDALTWEFYGELLPELQSRWDRMDQLKRPIWDGTYDGLIFCLSECCNAAGEAIHDDVAFMEWAVYRLLLESFCFLEHVRKLEEKHSGLLEEIRKQNRVWKQKLERMVTDVTAS